MQLDPAADISRRAWVPCPSCDAGDGCRTCEQGSVCAEHWRFLLEADGRNMFLQCPACRHRWWHDTRFGAGSRRRSSEELREFPPPGRYAA